MRPPAFNPTALLDRGEPEANVRNAHRLASTAVARFGRLGRACAAECLGTFLLVFFGLGVLHAAVLAKAQMGLFQVAIVWGIGVAIAVHASAAASGAHLNPAVTAAFALVGRFPGRHVIPYWGSQLLGAFLAASVLYALFSGFLEGVESAAGILRGGGRGAASRTGPRRREQA